MPTISRGSKSGGGTALEDSRTVLSAELNTDFDTVYNLLNGGLDGDNFDSTPAVALSQAIIDDISATAALYNTVTATGDSGTPSLPTNLEEELKRIRYALEGLSGMRGAVRVNGSGATTAGWIDIPATGPNLIENSRFPYKISATATDPPDLWTKVGTPTSLNLGTTDASEGGGNELQVVAGGTGQGVSQSVDFLKPSTRYVVIARVKVASGTAVLSTTGANASSEYRDLSITTTDSSFVTLKGLVETDATPTALVVQALSSGAAATFDVSKIGVYECTTDFDSADVATPAVIASNDSQSQATTYVNGSWTAVPGGDVTIAVPGPGYGLRVRGFVSGLIVASGGQLDVRLTMNVNGGGAAQVGQTVAGAFPGAGVQNTVAFDYAQQSVNAGDSLVLQLEGRTSTTSISSNPTSTASGDDLGSGIIVELVPTGV